MSKKRSLLGAKQNMIKVFISVVLVAIVVNQILWLSSMHKLYQNEFEEFINQSTEDAAWMEFSERLEKIGGFRLISGGNPNPQDTSRFFEKEVFTADSTYIFTIDKYDIHSPNKIIQFVIKDYLPTNLNILDSIFRNLVSDKYIIKRSFFDYIDLDSQKILNSNKLSTDIESKYFRTDTIILDIEKSIGIVGYSSIADNDIIIRMLWQLIISAILITIATLGIVYVSRSFLWLWKTEKMRQESIYAMTHEFKRPISVAMAGASLIPYYIETDESSLASSYAETINEELTKLTQYIDTIKQISNSDTSSINLDITNVEIKSFFQSIIDKYISSNLNEQELVNINLLVKTKKKEMHVDYLHLSNVIENLIENAIKYNVNSQITINLSIEDFDSKLKISVEDNGIGISKKDQRFIFSRYYRVNEAQTAHKLGFGLGLTYTKSIIEAHGGNISVLSYIDNGSKFIIII